MKLTSEPAYRTLTGPDPFAAAPEDDALADALAGLDEELPDELQAARVAASAAQNSPAATRF